MTLSELFRNFFTHKDFLPAADHIPGTLFTPLHFTFALAVAGLLTFLCIRFRKTSEKRLQKIYTVLWASLVILEIVTMAWDTLASRTGQFDWQGMLPLYPCSVFLYSMPLLIWGKGNARKAACGYLCSVGLLGGVINFVYPQTALTYYSCLSFRSFITFYYHAVLVFCCVTMLTSGYHSLRGVKKWWELLLPAVPLLCVSVFANIVNFSSIDADYMWFKLESMFFAPIGAATPDWLAVIVVYFLYLLIHALPLLPSYIANHRKKASAPV